MVWCGVVWDGVYLCVLLDARVWCYTSQSFVLNEHPMKVN